VIIVPLTDRIRRHMQYHAMATETKGALNDRTI
jgi:hypothetical protein